MPHIALRDVGLEPAFDEINFTRVWKEARVKENRGCERNVRKRGVGSESGKAYTSEAERPHKRALDVNLEALQLARHKRHKFKMRNPLIRLECGKIRTP